MNDALPHATAVAEIPVRPPGRETRGGELNAIEVRREDSGPLNVNGNIVTLFIIL